MYREAGNGMQVSGSIQEILTKTPRPEDVNSKQLNLFQNFLANDRQRDRLSNTIELWDAVPRYYCDRTQQSKLRHAAERTLPVLERAFEHGNSSFRVKIYPARIETSQGFCEYYPSVREELVEDALRKLSTQRNQGFLTETRSGCVFSLHVLRKELAACGHTMSYQQAYESLSILNASRIEVASANGKKMFKAPILPLLCGVSRSHLDIDPQAKWFCDFYPLVTMAINRLTYRQYDYERMMTHSSQLARWLHKRLAHNYIQASPLRPYTIAFSTTQRDSGLLDYQSQGITRPVQKLEDTCKELIADNVLMAYTCSRKRGKRRRLIDAIFTLTPTIHFTSQAKAANKRASDNTAFTR